MNASRVLTLILLFIASCLLARDAHGQAPPDADPRITVIKVQSRDVAITQRYTCRLSAHKHIDVRASEDGFIQESFLKEGQAVKTGEIMFRFVSILHRARLDFAMAEAQLAQLEFENTRKMFERKSVSETEVQLRAAMLAKARAKVDLAKAEFEFTSVKAPFDGIVGRIRRQPGSFVLKGESLTSLYDNSIMQAYYNVPETAYLESMARQGQPRDDSQFELVLADGRKFAQTGRIGAIEASFNEESGTILFRVDFPNPDRLLRHGQSGALLSSRVLRDAVVIPQRATFEDHGDRRVLVVDQDHVAHHRAIAVGNETDGLFVVKKGVNVGDLIVLDGIKGVRDGQKLEYEVVQPRP